MSHQININEQGTQSYIGKSALHEADNLTVTELHATITDIFSRDDISHKDLIHAGKLALEAGEVKRNAIWAAYNTKQPKKLGLTQGDYFLKYLGLEPYQTTKEIARAKIQSELSSQLNDIALNDSCLDELGKINKKFGKNLMCEIYEKCCLRISNENDLRLTKKLIQAILQTALKLSTLTSSKDHQNSVQSETSTAESSQPETTSRPNQEKQGQPESSQPETTSCPNQEKQGQPESSQPIGLKSEPKKELEVIAAPLQLSTPKLPSFRKKAQNKKLKKKAIRALHTKQTPLNSINNKLAYEQIAHQIGEQTFLIEQKLADAKGNLHKTEELLTDLLINRAEALLTCNRFAYSLEKFQPNARKTTKKATELTIYLETASCLRAEFINEIKNLIVL